MSRMLRSFSEVPPQAIDMDARVRKCVDELLVHPEHERPSIVELNAARARSATGAFELLFDKFTVQTRAQINNEPCIQRFQQALVLHYVKDLLMNYSESLNETDVSAAGDLMRAAVEYATVMTRRPCDHCGAEDSKRLCGNTGNDGSGTINISNTSNTSSVWSHLDEDMMTRIFEEMECVEKRRSHLRSHVLSKFDVRADQIIKIYDLRQIPDLSMAFLTNRHSAHNMKLIQHAGYYNTSSFRERVWNSIKSNVFVITFSRRDSDDVKGTSFSKHSISFPPSALEAFRRISFDRINKKFGSAISLTAFVVDVVDNYVQVTDENVGTPLVEVVVHDENMLTTSLIRRVQQLLLMEYSLVLIDPKYSQLSKLHDDRIPIFGSGSMDVVFTQCSSQIYRMRAVSMNWKLAVENYQRSKYAQNRDMIMKKLLSK